MQCQTANGPLGHGHPQDGVDSRTARLVVAARRGTAGRRDVLLLYLSQYRDSVTDTSPTTVLVAKSLIAKGTRGDVVDHQRACTRRRRSPARARSRRRDHRSGRSAPTGCVAETSIPDEQLTDAGLRATTDAVVEQARPATSARSRCRSTPRTGWSATSRPATTSTSSPASTSSRRLDAASRRC